MSKTRTAGDGMEAESKVVETLQENKCIYSKSIADCTFDSGGLVQIYPKNLNNLGNRTSPIHSKPLKFVPYEPYPAAVKPILPKIASKGTKKSKNNMDINTLISQMSQMKTTLNEFKPRTKSKHDQKVQDSPSQETLDLLKKLETVNQENESLKEQLGQQVQVNKELKTMLVASMGEDLEVQVQSLNEDKKHLANALLSSAQHLSTHQEQTEWLAGQCEVWRSKFLASSLMVEELANWKKTLSDRVDSLHRVIKQLLDERCRTRDMMMHTYKNLYSLHDKWLEDIAMSEYVGNNKVYRPIGSVNLTATVPHSTNILDLASVNLKLSENVSSSLEKRDTHQLNELPKLTEAERYAENVIAMPLELKKVNEEPVNALVHHAYNSGNTARTVASCLHCNGKVQLL